MGDVSKVINDLYDYEWLKDQKVQELKIEDIIQKPKDNSRPHRDG